MEKSSLSTGMSPSTACHPKPRACSPLSSLSPGDRLREAGSRQVESLGVSDEGAQRASRSSWTPSLPGLHSGYLGQRWENGRAHIGNKEVNRMRTPGTGCRHLTYFFRSLTRDRSKLELGSPASHGQGQLGSLSLFSCLREPQGRSGASSWKVSTSHKASA